MENALREKKMKIDRNLVKMVLILVLMENALREQKIKVIIYQ